MRSDNTGRARQRADACDSACCARRAASGINACESTRDERRRDPARAA